MSRRKRRIFRLLGWIVFGFISLILLITLTFYLSRGWIMNRAVVYLNKNQPGEVQMGQMNLIPFMGFPDVALQLRNVSYYERAIVRDSLYQEPILSFNEMYVSLDVIDLIRGDIQVSQARLEDGFIRIEIYEDSVINLEKALGIRFGEKTENDSVQGLPSLRIALDKIQISNILVMMQDRTRDDHVNLTINRLESRFSYLPELVEAGVELDIDVNDLKYLTYKAETSRNIQIESDVSLDLVHKQIEIAPSSLKVSGLELETWGSYGFLDEPQVDIAFRARNTGLDVLNYLFRGILDLDEIEQIGSGSINLNGNINGRVGKQLPVIRLNGTADQIGFRIKSIQKDVTDISFNLYATNGNKLDLSEGIIEVEGFKATFPEGTISGNISVKNMISPEVNIEINGEVNLAGLEQMVQSDALADLEGIVRLDCRIDGVVNRNTGEFLNDAGSLKAILSDVGFVLNQDTVSRINGEVFIQESIISTDGLDFAFNGNRITLGAKIENLLHYLLDYECDVNAEISIASEVLYPATLIRDTSVARMLGEELRGLNFSAGAIIAKNDLDAFLQNGSIPEVQLSLDSFEIELPVYADISNMNAFLTFSSDTLALHHLNGMIGESGFSFSGLVANFGTLKGQDSGAVVNIEYDLSSDLMRAEDFFTFNDDFMLPETYQTEYLEDFRLSGTLEVPVSGLMIDSSSLDFSLNIVDLGWNFRYYPLTFDQFLVKIRREGNKLFIDDFSGKIGESNLKMSATLENFTDSLIENIYGSLVLESDLLDFNELLNYQLPEELRDTAGVDSTGVREPPRLDQINYPEFSFEVDIEELRYGEYNIYGLNGRLRASKDKIFYLDRLVTSGKSAGQIEFNGQFNVSNPLFYTFSAELDMEDMNINDLDFEMQSGEETYTLKENFAGLVSANGLAEIFITPDLKVDMSSTTAVFNVGIVDGALINFAPLQAAGKYLDNKDLNHVKFATFRNSFPLTLMDSRIIIPLTIVESTIGQLLIEGEQGLDNSYLYLLRVPTWLVKGAVKSVLTNAGDEEEEDQIHEMKMGKFLMMTAWSDGEESEVKLKDRREDYQ
ncbi:MAG: hypothetical protein KAR19_17495 [Bacteroidales bacterium]|nr:hypothetical protein [Bacteroidales bacterium]